MGKLARETIEVGVDDTAKSVVFTFASASEVKYPALFETTITTMGTSYAGIVELPSVKEAEGIQFSIMAHDVTNATTVRDKDDSEDWAGDYTLDTTDDMIVLRSDGKRWIVVENRIA